MEKLFRSFEPLKRYCTYEVGGPARLFFEPHTPEEFTAALSWANTRGISCFVLGKGSNVLISDKGFDGLVICTRALDGFSAADREAWALCGADLGTFIEACSNRGFSGLAELYDIPGSVGGAVFMNAGAFDSVISDALVAVHSVDSMGREYFRRKEELDFAYRDSTFRRNGEFVLKASFRLNPGAPETLLEDLKRIKARRDAKQPPDRAKSCGSVFKRPPGNFAGTLIEKAGCKGLRIGDARVSEVHANFIINDGNARASDIRQLIDNVRTKVFESSGVQLETEVVFLGEFQDDR